MNKSGVIEILARLADRLPGSNSPPQPGSGRYERVQGLLDLAGELQGILVPVRPDPAFRRQLHGQLVRQAQDRQAAPGPGLFYQHRRGILIGAAAVGSMASVAGVVIAFVLRYRHSRAGHVATG